MPWCPECDEVFPEGPACPRCRTPLVDVGDEGGGEPSAAGKNLPQVEVPRRLRRAMQRMGREPAPPRHLLLFALACILFAGGFVAGRMGSLVPDQPVVGGLSSAPVDLPLDGAVSYVARVPGPPQEPAIVRHDLTSGGITHDGRFSLPAGVVPSSVDSSVDAYGESVAVLLSGRDGMALVGAFPLGRGLPVWVDGSDAAWESEMSLLVLRDGTVTRWSFEDGLHREDVPGSWTRVLSTPDGAVLEGLRDGRRRVWAATPNGLREAMALPEGARLVAADAGAERVLVEGGDEIALWDGSERIPVRADGREAVAAAFSPGGGRVAMTTIERGRPDGSTPVHLAVVDARGNAALHPVAGWRRGQSCEAAPAWDDAGRWVYLSPGDGAVYAVEAGGGARVEGASARTLGCGIGWVE